MHSFIKCIIQQHLTAGADWPIRQQGICPVAGLASWWKKIYLKLFNFTHTAYLAIKLIYKSKLKKNLTQWPCRLSYLHAYLIAHVFMRIFQSATLLSKYPQPSGMDFMKAHVMVMSTINTLQTISGDFPCVKYASDVFLKAMNNRLE